MSRIFEIIILHLAINNETDGDFAIGICAHVLI